MKSRLSIGDLARSAGLRASAIRYYESIGVLPKPARTNGRRVYDASTVERLRRIRLAQESGFDLGEIKMLEKGLTRDGPQPNTWRRLAASKLGEVEAQIHRLEQMREILHATMRCTCISLAACPVLARDSAAAEAPAR